MNDRYKLAAIKLVTPSKEHLEKHCRYYQGIFISWKLIGM